MVVTAYGGAGMTSSSTNSEQDGPCWVGVLGSVGQNEHAALQVLEQLAVQGIQRVFQLGGLFDNLSEVSVELEETLARTGQKLTVVSRTAGDARARARIVARTGEPAGESAHVVVLGRADRDRLPGGHSVVSMSGDGRRADFVSTAEILEGAGQESADMVLSDLVPALVLRGKGEPAVNRRQALLQLRPWVFVGPSPRFVVRNETLRPPDHEPFTTSCIELPRVPDVAVIVDLRKRSIEYIDNRGTRIPVGRDDPPLDPAKGGRWLVTAANGRWRLDLDLKTAEQVAGDPTKPRGPRALIELPPIRIGEPAVLLICARDASYTMTVNLGIVAAIQPWEWV